MQSQVTSFNNVLNGKVTVTTGGTRVQLGTAACKAVAIIALSTNTGIIYLGNSAVTNGNGLQLTAGQPVSLAVTSLGAIWIDCSVNGDGVTYIAVV